MPAQPGARRLPSPVFSPDRVIDCDDSGRPMVLVGNSGPARLLLSEPTRRYEDEPSLDFLVRARRSRGSAETSVETWDGDGFDAFVAEDFRGWEGARTCASSERAAVSAP